MRFINFRIKFKTPIIMIICLNFSYVKVEQGIKND